MKKLIKDMNYIELTDHLSKKIKFNEDQFIKIKSHKNVSDWTYWGKNEWTIEIIKDNGNLYNDVDILVIKE